MAAELIQTTWSGRSVVELEGPHRVTPEQIAATFVANIPDLNDIKGIICESYTAQLPPPALFHPPVYVVSNWMPGGCS